MTAYTKLIVDLDGTLYRGPEPLLAAVETMERLRHSCSVLFLSNNCNQSSDHLARRLRGLGFEAGAHEVVGDIVELVEQHELQAEVIAASVRTPEELMLAWKVGAGYAAIQSNVVAKICSNPAVEATTLRFHQEYTQTFGNIESA